MICPKCEYEYREGFTVCSDCNTKLIPVEEFEGNLVHYKDWIILATMSDEYEINMLKANLEGAEIETHLLGQKDRNYPAPGDFSVLKLMVKKKDADDAIAIINDIYKDED